MTEQANEWGEDFCSFFIHKRLKPQLLIAGQKGKEGGREGGKKGGKEGGKEEESVFAGKSVERLLFKVRREGGREGGREGS